MKISQKSLISYNCFKSQHPTKSITQRLHIQWTKAWGQTVLTDRSNLIRQKLVENAKMALIIYREPKAWSQTVLTARSILIGQKLIENAKMANLTSFWKPKLEVKQR